MKKLTFLLALLIASLTQTPVAHSAGSSITKSSDTISDFGFGPTPKRVREVVVAFVGDNATGAVPSLSVSLKGYLIKVITNPGATAPTDNYDITLGDPEDSGLDAAASALLNRDTANTEVAYPIGGAAPAIPIFLNGTYTLSVANNSVNSATGRILLYLVDSL